MAWIMSKFIDCEPNRWSSRKLFDNIKYKFHLIVGQITTNSIFLIQIKLNVDSINS